ncbi:MAG: DUF4405 domain-containing protein [Phycisphaerae bacterium]|nr:DUF4405 domain-containing protein [Phycisphaerae bacterium]
MKRNTLNFAVDLASLLVMWALVATGLLMKYVMPPGTGHWLALGGMNRHGWGDVHFWLAVAACALMFLHVFLHWQWVVGTTRRLLAPSGPSGHLPSLARRALSGAGLLAVLLVGTVGLLAAADSMVVQLEPSEAEIDHHHHHPQLPPNRERVVVASQPGQAQDRNPAGKAPEKDPHHRIRCGTTLGQAAAIKELPIDELRRRLRIPSSVPESETVADAGAKHGFTVHDVRALAEGRRATTAPSGQAGPAVPARPAPQ